MNKLIACCTQGLFFLWELPQTIIGWVISRFLKIEKTDDYQGRRLICFDPSANWFSRLLSGASFGFIIVLPIGSSIKTVKHEYGHCMQSRKWGWLYLMVIGAPSLYNNLRGRIVYKDWTYEQAERDYYSRYPEKEADILGMVER